MFYALNLSKQDVDIIHNALMQRPMIEAETTVIRLRQQVRVIEEGLMNKQIPGAVEKKRRKRLSEIKVEEIKPEEPKNDNAEENK